MNSATRLLDYNDSDVLRLLEADPGEVVRFFELFSHRTIHIKQLGIDRNTFINWEKGGVIPYQREESGWRRFSFLESVWIKTVEELRSLGVAVDTIRGVKELLWPKDASSFGDYIIKGVESSPVISEEKKKEVLAQIQQEGVEGLARIGGEEVQFCTLMLFVITAVVKKVRYCLLINKAGDVSLFPLVPYTEGMNPAIIAAQQALFSSSGTLIHLWPIIEGLALGAHTRLPEEALLQFISSTEQKILELVKEKKYTEVIITKGSDGTPTHIKVKSRELSGDVIKKLHSYLKKGDYQSIGFKTRDGQLIHYEETTNIKLSSEKEGTAHAGKKRSKDNHSKT